MPKGVHLPRVTLDCAHCGKPFSRVGSDADRIFCSQTCRWAAPRAKQPNLITCERCGTTKPKTTHTNKVQRFCSLSCARKQEGLRRKLKTREQDIWPAPREAKAVLLDENPSCRDCGWSVEPAILELHHVDRNRRHNKRSNLTLLCPNCHTLRHYRDGTGQFKNNVGKLVA